MNKKFLTVIISVLSMIAGKAEAQGIVFVTEDTGMPVFQGYNPYQEVLVHIPPVNYDNVVIQNSAFTENNTANLQNSTTATQSTIGDENKDISYYMQRISLSPEQLNRAQEISNTTDTRKQQLLQSIETLKEQADELENDGLRSFEAILTDEQKTEFNRLRYEQNTVVQSEPQPEVYSEPQPEPQLEPQPEVYSEPQPEPQPENVQ